MNPARWAEVEHLLQSALDHTGDERSLFLARACGADTELRTQVEDLLDADRRAEGFLASSAVEDAADLFSDEDSELVTGSRIGHYVVERQLGSGGSGEVYLARDIRLGRHVALKLLDGAIADDTASRARFLREARLASALTHAHVCTVHDVGEIEGRLFIAMQYVQGQTLRRRIGGCPLPFDELYSMAMQVAEALAAAHAHGIVHRDVKSCNIMVTPEDHAVVLDFGLAQRDERDAALVDDRITSAGTVFGTPASMSPEQARGTAMDHRSDIFSFGVVLYEMATGRMPFQGQSRADIVGAVLATQQLPVAALNPSLPLRLSAVIDRALAKDAADRYQSMAELQAELHGTIDDQSRSASRLSARVGAAVVGLVAVVALALFVGGMWPARQPRDVAAQVPRGRSLAVLPFKSLIVTQRNEALEIGMADTLITSLSAIPGIDVRPINAVRNYDGLGQDALAAGREQRVDTVLDGGLQTSGDRVRVTVRLLNVADGRQLWTARFDERLTNIFALQDAISDRVSAALAARLVPDHVRSNPVRHVADVEAYQLYLLGRYHLIRLTDEGFSKALDYFQRAVAKDPGYAEAYAGMAKAYVSLSSFNALRPRDGMPKARQAATTALRLDDRIAAAHAALAEAIFLHDWDWRAAEVEYRRALALNPGDPDSHLAYGYYLATMGRSTEAISETTRAVELNPVSLTSIAGLGDVLHMARRYEAAEAQFRKTLDMDPTFGYGHWALGRSLIEQRRYGPAVSALRQSIPLSGDSPDETAELARAYALSGKKDDALALLARLTRLSRRRYVAPTTFAALHAALGNTEQAFAWLARARAERDFLLVLTNVEPMFDPLRSDARFTVLLAAMKFPAPAAP